MPAPNGMTRHLVRGPGWAAVARCVGVGLAWVALMLASPAARAQGQAPAPAGATADSEIEGALAAEDEPIPPKDQKLDNKLMHWSDYAGENFTFHFGYNLMYDFVGYKQDPGSVAQWGVLVNPGMRWRD